MVQKNFLLSGGAVIAILILISVNLASASFSFAGYTKYTNGTNMTNVNISLEINIMGVGGPPTSVTVLSVLSNSSGFFNMTINDTYDNDSYMYHPVIAKYNGTTGTGDYVEFIGQSLPSFESLMFTDLGAITFYLKQAISVDLNVVGNSHSGTQISYGATYTLPNDYKIGFDIANESGLYGLNQDQKKITYSYVNLSDCLIILNSTRGLNMSFCDLNISNIRDAERFNWGQNILGEQESYYFLNTTDIERCYTSSENLTCNSSVSFTNPLNYSTVSGIVVSGIRENLTYIFVSGVNSSGTHIISKFYPNLTYAGYGDLPNRAAGKMARNFGWGNIYFASNNSGRYYFYDCYVDQNADIQCGPDSTPVNFSTGDVVTGISYFNGNLYYVSNASKNFTSISTETDAYQFMYQVKDSALGYSVKENWNTPSSSTRFSIPSERDYSIMIYPYNGPAFPSQINLADLIEGSNISYGDRNATVQAIGGGLYVNLSNANMSTGFVRLPGYIKWNTSSTMQNFTSLTVIAYLFEGGNMVYKDSTLPANMGQWQNPQINDLFNTTTGFYNMTLPASILGANILLFATAKVNNSGTIVYYGGFRNVTLRYDSNATETNFTLYPLIGEEADLSVGFEGQNDASTVATKLKSFNITANGSAVDQAHVELEVDYSSISGSNVRFSWMGETESGIFNIPLFNYTVKKMQVFSSQYSPLKKEFSRTAVQEDPIHINLTSFENKKPDGEALNDSLIEMMVYINKEDGSCSVPYPDDSCSPFNGEEGAEFNPFSLVIGGGKIDFEIKKTDNNITVRYINVDLLASGPPDAIFDDAANSSGGGLEEAWRFGSLGPNIYDYVLLGIPYNESIINESLAVKINITKFYGESFNTPDWRQGSNSTSQLNGTDYEDYAIEIYAPYINGAGVTCSATDANLTSGRCYKDTTGDMLWFKIPHFSGIGPSVVGTSSSGTSDDDDDGGGGGGGGGAVTNATNVTNKMTTAVQGTGAGTGSTGGEEGEGASLTERNNNDWIIWVVVAVIVIIIGFVIYWNFAGNKK